MDKQKNINKLNNNKIPDSFAVSFFVREISNLNYSCFFVLLYFIISQYFILKARNFLVHHF